MVKILKLEEDTHTKIKVLAAKSGITMKEYIAKLIEKEVQNNG